MGLPLLTVTGNYQKVGEYDKVNIDFIVTQKPE